jgi:hypothetical protein
MNSNVDQATQQIRRERTEKLLAKAQAWPVGSRWTEDGDDEPFTIIGFDYDLEEPLALADEATGGHEFAILSDFVTSPDELTRAADDPDLAERACATARGCGVPQHLNLWDTPTTVDQILAASDYREANHAWLSSQRAERAAALARGYEIAAVVGQCGGNQSAAARLLGLEQSRVSRTIKDLPVVP